MWCRSGVLLFAPLKKDFQGGVTALESPRTDAARRATPRRASRRACCVQWHAARDDSPPQPAWFQLRRRFPCPPHRAREGSLPQFCLSRWPCVKAHRQQMVLSPSVLNESVLQSGFSGFCTWESFGGGRVKDGRFDESNGPHSCRKYVYYYYYYFLLI